MENQNNRKKALQKRIEQVLKGRDANLSDLSGKTVEDILQEVSIYHQELEFQNLELMRIQQELEASEKHYEELFSNAPMGYVVFDKQFIIHSANHMFASWVGNKIDEIIGKPLSLFIHPNYQDQLYLFAKKIWNERVKDSLLLAINGKGKMIHVKVECNIHEAESGTLTRMGLIDISSEVRNQQKLIDSRERYRVVSEYAYNWEYWQDADGKMLYISPSCERITGYSKHDFFQNPKLLVEIIHPADKHLFHEHEQLSRIQRKDEVEHKADFRIIRKDGEMRWIGHVCYNIFSADGTYLGIRCSNNDITENKHNQLLKQLRLNLFDYAARHSLNDFMVKTIDEIEYITGSEIGFFHFLLNDEKTISLQAWSSKTTSTFCQAQEAGTHYNVDCAGVWVDCIHQRKPVIHNDYTNLKHKKGMPQGHAKVTRELVVPIFKDEKIVAILGVGNKPTNYNESDIETAWYLADVAWEIAQKKKAEEELLEKEAYLRTIIQTTTDGFWVVDKNRRKVDVNDAYLAMSGYTREEFLQLTVNDVDAEEDIKQTQERIKRIIKNGSEIFETRHRRKDGSVFDVEVSATYIERDGGLFVCFCRDITQRKQWEQKLIVSDRIFNHALDMLCIAGFDGYFKTLNPAWSKVLGYSTEELLSKPWIEFVHPNDRQATENIQSVIVDGEEVYQFENRYICKDGSVKWLSWNSFPYPNENIMYGVARDITFKKQAEEKLFQSELKLKEQVEEYLALNEELNQANEELRNLMENLSESTQRNSALVAANPDIMFVYNREGVFLDYHTPNPKELLLNPDGFLYKRSDEVLPKYLADINQQAINQLFETGKPQTYNYSIEINGNTKHFDARMVRYGKDKALAIVRDITEKKKAEEEIALMASMLDLAPSAITVHDMDGNFLYTNNHNLDIHGYSHDEFLKLNLQMIDVPESKELIKERIKTILDNGEASFEVEHFRKDGTLLPLMLYVKIVDWKGKKSLLSIGTDIREAKKAKAKLLESNRNISFLAETAMSFVDIHSFDSFYSFIGDKIHSIIPEAFLMVNSVKIKEMILTTRNVYGNNTTLSKLTSILGYSLKGKTYPINKSFLMPNNKKLVLVKGGIKEFALGNIPDILVPTIEKLLNVNTIYGIAVLSDEEIVASIGMVFPRGTDIKNVETIEAFIKQASIAYKRIKVEEELRYSEERYRSLYESTPAMLHSIDKEGRIISVSNTWLQKLGYAKDEVIGRKSIDFLTEESKRIAVEVYLPEFFKKGISKDIYYQMVTRNGEVLDVLMSVVAEKTNSKEFVRSMAVIEDITERKKAEKALRESEQRFQLSMEATKDGLWEWDIKSDKAYFSPAYYTMLGYQDGAFEASGKTWSEMLHPEDKEKSIKIASDCINGITESFEMEFRMQANDGTWKWILGRAKSVERDNYGKALRIVGTHVDISERKVNEETLRQRNTFIQTVLDNLPIGVALNTINEGKATYINKKFVEIYGWPKEELLDISRFFEKVYPDPDYRKELIQRIMADIQSGDPERMRWENIKVTRKDGSHAIINAVNIPLVEQNTMVSTVLDVTEQKKAESEQRKLTMLLDSVRNAQSLYIAQDDTQPVFDSLLKTLLEITESEFGFLDEVFYEPDGTPYKLSLAISNISWDKDSEKLYKELSERNLEFRNLNNLAGLPALNKKSIIANDVSADKRAGGLPKGHPGIKSFMGLPVFYGKEVVGVIGVANRKEGYTEELAKFLEPYLNACAGIIQDIRMRKKEKEMVNAIRESEEKYHNLFEANTDGIAIFRINPDGTPTRFIESNSSAARMLGYSDKEFLSFYMTQLEVDIDPEETVRRVTELKSQGITEFETKLLHKSGNLVFVNIKAVAINYLNQPAILNITRDITERKLAEKQLRESEERFRGLYENATVGIYRTTPSGQIQMANPALLKMLGYDSFEELAQRDLTKEGYEPDYKREFFINMIEAYGEVKALESEWKCKDGKPIFVSESARVVRDDKGKHLYYEGIVEDITERRKAIDALKASQERISSIFRVAPTGIGVVKDRVIIEVNPMLCEMTGYPPEELLGKSALILYPSQEEFDYVGTEKYRQIAEKGTGTVETCWVKKDGTVINIILSSTPIIEDDLSQGISFTAMDISGRKQMEINLRQSEEKFRLLFENMTQGFALHEIITDEKGKAIDYKYLDINPAFERLTGLKANNLMGKTILEVMPNTERHWIETYGKVAETGESIRYENYARELCKYFDVSAFCPERGLFAVVFSDITERKLAEEQVQMLSKGIEQSPAIVVITDVKGNIEFINPKFSEVTGYSLDEVMGKNPRILKSGRQDEQFYHKLWSTILKGNDWRGEMINRKKAGKEYWESALISPIKDEKGDIKHFIAIKEDITERKNAEQALIQSEQSLKEKNEQYLALNEELVESYEKIQIINQDLVKAREKAEESDRLKTAFLANMSHEIRTPMNAIIGFSEFLLKPSLPKEKQEFFSVILNTSCHQLLNVVNDMIDIAKIETGQVDIHMGKTNINQIIRRICSIYSPQAQQKEVTVNQAMQLTDNFAEVSTDTVKLNQIITNLVANAVKFTEQGFVEVGYTIKNEFIEFYVKDTGIGIAREHHDIIFERFRQVEIDTTRKYGGTGLGLSISKAFVEMLGGKIWLDSELDMGSTFYFTLPYKPLKQVELVEKSEEAIAVDLKGKLILLAEDEYANYLYVNDVIGDTGAKLIYAKNGREAVELFTNNPAIELIIMDIKMPEMDGIAATQAIRKSGAKVPIIALTAYALSGDKERFIEAGCNSYLSKPILRADLLREMEKLLKL